MVTVVNVHILLLVGSSIAGSRGSGLIRTSKESSRTKQKGVEEEGVEEV